MLNIWKYLKKNNSLLLGKPQMGILTFISCAHDFAPLAKINAN